MNDMRKIHMLGLLLLVAIIIAIPNIAFPSTPIEYKPFDRMEMFILPHSSDSGIIEIVESNDTRNDSLYHIPLYYKNGGFVGWLYNNTFVSREDSPFDIFIDIRFNNTYHKHYV